MMRSVLAVVAGYVVIAVGVIVATLFAAKLMLGSIAMDGSVRPTAAYLFVNLTYSLVFAAIGGYVAATFSSRRPVAHALALGIFMLVMGVFSLAAGSGNQPSWYPALVTFGGAGCAVLGGWVRAAWTKPS